MSLSESLLATLVLAGILASSSAGLRAEAPTRYEIETVAGTGKAGYSGDGGAGTEARLDNPFGITRGPDGALYICDTGNHTVRRLDAAGTITTVAGTGEAGYSGDGGPATAARLNEPYEVRFDRQGHLYFVEMRNHLVRRVDRETRIISTVAGTGQKGFSGDGGPAVRARFSRPHSIQFGPDGRLFICDIGNHRIRVLDPETGRIETFAGTGQRGPIPDGVGLENLALNGPRAIDFDREGNLWLALREGNAICKIDLRERRITHVAGTGKKGFTGHEGPARQATLSGPKGIAISPSGDIFFADTESHSIRYIERSTGQLKLLAGTGKRGDGPEPDPLRCRMARPHGVFVDRDGSIFVGDSETHRVRRIVPIR